MAHVGHSRVPLPLRVLPPRRARGLRQGAHADVRRDGRRGGAPLGDLLLLLCGVDDPGRRPPGSPRRPAGGGRRRPGDGGRDAGDGLRLELAPAVRRTVPRRGRRCGDVRRSAQDRRGVVPAVLLRHPLGGDGHDGGPGRPGGDRAPGLAGDRLRLARGARRRRRRHAGRSRALPAGRPRPASRARRRTADSGSGLARGPGGARTGPGQPRHVATVRGLLLPLLGHQQPLLLGRAVPARRLWPGHGGGGALLDGDVGRPPRGRAAHRVPLGPGAPAPAATLRRPDGRAVRRLGRLRPDARPAPAVGPLRALLRHGDGRRGVRPDVAARARGQPAGARRHRGRGREPRRVRRRRADAGPARGAPRRALDGRDAGRRADLSGGGVPAELHRVRDPDPVRLAHVAVLPRDPRPERLRAARLRPA